MHDVSGEAWTAAIVKYSGRRANQLEAISSTFLLAFLSPVHPLIHDDLLATLHVGIDLLCIVFFGRKNQFR